MAVREFLRAAKYNPEWLHSSVSGGANPLQMTEWLTEVLELKPGMRVLDLGCGRAVSSIFLRQEFGVEVWACDLWFNVTENLQRIRDAGVENGVFPLHVNARELPFANEFFDVILSIDSFLYYGTDDLYLEYLARFLKPGGQIGIAGAGLMTEIEGTVPQQLAAWWTSECWSFHTADWWHRHWQRTGIIDVKVADTLPEGWQLWLEWHRSIAPDNAPEINALLADEGRYLGYVRVAGRRNDTVVLNEPVQSLTTTYYKLPLMRDEIQLDRFTK